LSRKYIDRVKSKRSSASMSCDLWGRDSARSPHDRWSQFFQSHDDITSARAKKSLCNGLCLRLAPCTDDITLYCTGSLITSAFVLGAGNILQLTDGLLYFLFFDLGFGWPLVLLPFAAMSFQRQFTGWLTQHHRLLTRISGTLLVMIGCLVFG